jgi:hypothetical protein
MITAAFTATAQRHGQHEQRPLGNRVEIEHHAHRQEEQAEQDGAERLDIGFQFVAIGAVGQHDPGDERAQRGGQAKRLHHCGRGHHREQRGDHEHLALAQVADQAEQRRIR